MRGGGGMQMNNNTVVIAGTFIQWKYYTQVKINELELHDESHKQCKSKKAEKYIP